MRKRNIIILGSLIGAAAGWAFAHSNSPLETVPNVDLSRYTGRWYEIARYPNRFERKCDRDVTAEYSIKNNGDIRVANSCVKSSGAITQAIGTAKAIDKATNAKLKVAFFWPFYGKYWIIDLGQNYDYAVVGEPAREYLWILSRTPQMPDPLYQQITARLASKGYDASKLVKTRQTALR
ncbi:MAG TPA: lipocalin family protein [Candidatus Dormibacteraeota bacterium]|nr:lipocalin family protein [Candidatus Dormibacteraeota bacterium]